MLLDGRVNCIMELYSRLVGGGNATSIGCQPPLKLIKEEDVRVSDTFLLGLDSVLDKEDS